MRQASFSSQCCWRPFTAARPIDGLVWDSFMLRAPLSRVPGLVDEAQPVRRIAFFHPPKCGGTSIRTWLASTFGRPAGLDPLAAEAAAHNIGVASANERE